MCHDLERYLSGSDWCCAANGRTRCSTLDCAARWGGIDTVGAAGCIGSADSGKYGCVDHRAGGAGLEVVVLLCRDGDTGMGDRGAWEVSAGARRRQRNINEESFSDASGKDHRNFLAVGILVYRDSDIPAAAGAAGAVRDCR